MVRITVRVSGAAPPSVCSTIGPDSQLIPGVWRLSSSRPTLLVLLLSYSLVGDGHTKVQLSGPGGDQLWHRHLKRLVSCAHRQELADQRHAAVSERQRLGA